MRVLFATSEATPFIKSGGLADVLGSLPKEMAKKGVESIVVLPKYQDMKLADKIEYAFRRQRELKRAVPLTAFGEIKYCAFISMPGIIQYPIQEQIDYAYAAASRNEKNPCYVDFTGVR